MAETVKEGFAGFFRRLRPAAENHDEMEEEALESLPATDLDRLVPSPDWQAPALALEQRLESWEGGPTQNPMAVTVIGPTHSGRSEVLERFATDRGWRRIAAPDPAQILAGDRDWLSRLRDDDSPWVLPGLEKCYLRHVHGLTLLRGLFESLQAGATGPGVIGCDSWAAAYLDHAIPGLLRNRYTLQAFDHERLGRWLQSLATHTPGRAPRFKQQNSGRCILPATNPEERDNGQFLRHLAAYSRGIPGVARAIWRSALRNRPESDDDEKGAGSVDERSCPPSHGLRGNTVWVLPWKNLRHAAAESILSSRELQALHALLLHDGLPAHFLG